MELLYSPVQLGYNTCTIGIKQVVRRWLLWNNWGQIYYKYSIPKLSLPKLYVN
jgi:hypothetical protein